jgi:hypothetical protein
MNTTFKSLYFSLEILTALTLAATLILLAGGLTAPRPSVSRPT